MRRFLHNILLAFACRMGGFIRPSASAASAELNYINATKIPRALDFCFIEGSTHSPDSKYVLPGK